MSSPSRPRDLSPSPVSEDRELSKVGRAHDDGEDAAAADPTDLERVERLAEGEWPRFVRGRWSTAGGMGALDEVYDRLLGRRLVRKRPRDDRRAPQDYRAFVHEAQVTADLNHPSIVPLLDLKRDAEGLYYLMPWVEGETLQHVLAAIARGDRDRRRRFGLARLLHVFRTVCGAVAHAHERGIVHRDLKPDQIVLGPHDEVLVLDWGLAARLGRVVEGLSRGTGSLDAGSIRSGQTVLDGVYGAPRYQPPERLIAGQTEPDPAQDVFALGAVLYHVLTLRPPVGKMADGEEEQAYLDRIRREVARVPPPSTRAWQPPIDPIWDDICLRCLAVVPGDRFADARELYQAVEAALSELEEAERRAQLADAAIREGEAASRRWHDAVAELERTRALRRRLLDGSTPQQSVEEHRELWGAEDQEHAQGIAVAERFAEAERAFELALSHDAGSRAARRHLADLHFQKLRAAESAGDRAASVYHRSRLARYDDGSLAAELDRGATLEVEATPAGCRVELAELEERDRRLVAGRARALGTTPLEPTELPPGRFLLTVRGEGRATARYALRSGAGEYLRLTPALPLAERVPAGFVYLPAGPCWIGGDPMVPDATERRRVQLPDLAVAALPVTMAEYLQFLDDLPEGQARARVPADVVDGTPLWQRRDGRWQIPDVDPHGDPLEPTLPVLAVRAEDAEAYAAWRSDTEGRPYRLPTRDEWEYAARSADGRAFPWGDRFVAGYCWAGQRQRGRPQPAPVGRCAEDCSPTGVRDLAGGVGDWLADDFAADGSLRQVGGGSWFASERFCRLARRFGFDPLKRSDGLGFRLLLELGDED